MYFFRFRRNGIRQNRIRQYATEPVSVNTTSAHRSHQRPLVVDCHRRCRARTQFALSHRNKVPKVMLLCFVAKNSYLIQEHHRRHWQPPYISQQQLSLKHPSRVWLITATDHNGPQRTATEADLGTMGRQELQKRRSELREPQGRQTEVRETVMKCKGNGVSCQNYTKT